MDRLERLESMLIEAPNDPFIHYALALEFKKGGDCLVAKSKFQYLLQNHPEYLPTYYHYAQLLAEVEEVDEAIKVYELGIQLAMMQSDQHAMSELKNAKLNLEIEWDL